MKYYREFAKQEKLSFFEGLEAFNEKHYLELLESLEVSEVGFSAIDLNDRYDAENFSKEYLRVFKFLKNKRAKFLSAVTKSIKMELHGAGIPNDGKIWCFTDVTVCKWWTSRTC